MHETRYCPTCDYATSASVVAQSRVDFDCPRCHLSRASEFYTHGSFTHRDRRAAWLRGEVWGAPMPLRTPEDLPTPPADGVQS